MSKNSVPVRQTSLSYNNADSQASALRLVLLINPDWEQAEGKIEFVRFTDGITNTLLKVIKRRPGYTEEQIDQESVLLRAYGNNTSILIDRDREETSHSLLAEYNLAPPLLVRFQNGLLYKFIRGRITQPIDLAQKPISRAIARRLGEWHARLPIISEDIPTNTNDEDSELGFSFPGSSQTRKNKIAQDAARNIAPGKATPNIWSVMQKWIFALPNGNEVEKARNELLQTQLEKVVEELSNRPGLGQNGLIFGHCDLLSGNVVVHPRGSLPEDGVETVSFIDYEYATPSPAAFDIANHFAEWVGFDCDYNNIPTRLQRMDFLREYLTSYNKHSGLGEVDDAQLDNLFIEVDIFRGIPGFYWGIWALIQAMISQIDFDYASYAELRLGEFWAWREEAEGTREAESKVKSLRERRWQQEA